MAMQATLGEMRCSNLTAVPPLADIRNEYNPVAQQTQQFSHGLSERVPRKRKHQQSCNDSGDSPNSPSDNESLPSIAQNPRTVNASGNDTIEVAPHRLWDVPALLSENADSITSETGDLSSNPGTRVSLIGQIATTHDAVQSTLWHDQQGSHLIYEASQQHLADQNVNQAASQSTAHNWPTFSQPLETDQYDGISFMHEQDFSIYEFSSPGVSEFLNLATPLPHPPKNSGVLNTQDSGSPDILFSVEQMLRMRQSWRRRRSFYGAHVSRSTWHSVVHHQAPNILSKPQTSEQGDPIQRSGKISRWGIDDEFRDRVTAFCKELDKPMYSEDLTTLTPRSTPQASNFESVSENSTTLSSPDGYPAREVLEAGLDVFFHCSHLPFIHKATFDVRAIPESLLFAVCLVGISSLYPERSKSFVLRYEKKMMRFCLGELAFKAPGHCQPWDLLMAIATTLLVVYLALGFLEDVDESQAYLLCSQMLQATERNGLFTTSDGGDYNANFRIDDDDDRRESSWLGWNRSESIKRMICCLLWMDLAYTRLMGGAGTLNMDKVAVYLPCDDVLFDATTSDRFLQVVRSGVPLMMPQMQVQSFHAGPPSALNHLSVETILVALYLEIAALRHKPRSESENLPEFKSSDLTKILSTNDKAKDVIATLLLLPSKYANLFRQRHRVTAFAWNNVCIAITADLDLLELASGREGLESARHAMLAVAVWSQSARGRRAVLHAAQIFDILSSSRLSEWNIARPDLLLFQSVLVLSMYLFVPKNDEKDQESPVFELLQDIDWTAVGAEGILPPQTATELTPSLDDQRSPQLACAAHRFIRHGGPLSFSGEPLSSGGATARKVLLKYVHLLDDIGKYRGSSYSQLLRTMSDFVIEGNY